MRDDAVRDVELHRRVATGDREAFHELYRRYGSAAYGLALRITAQPMLAEEVTQDAFLALWRTPEAFDPTRGAFRSFLLSLVHHRAVDAVRREERLRRRAERASNLEPVRGEDVADVVVEDAYMGVRRKEVLEALAILSPEQRQGIEPAYFSGLPQTRIAQRPGIPVGTVKTRTLAAMRKLRRSLEPED